MRTKIKIADLQKKLTFPAFRKEFMRLTKAMQSDKVQGGSSPEDAVSIFVKVNHQFVCETEHPLVIVAAHGPAWKKAAKDAFKEDKKMMLEGRCFVDDSNNLNIIVEKGNLKLTELKKVVKALLKKAGLKTVVFSDGKGTITGEEEEATTTTEESSPEEARTDAATPDNSTEETTTATAGEPAGETAEASSETTETSSETATDASANPADARREQRREKQKEKGRKAIEAMTKQLENLMGKLRI